MPDPLDQDEALAREAYALFRRACGEVGGRVPPDILSVLDWKTWVRFARHLRNHFEEQGWLEPMAKEDS